METGEGKPKPPSPAWPLTWPSPLPPTKVRYSGNVQQAELHPGQGGG